MTRLSPRDGFALVIVLLLAIALSSLTAGMIVLAQREWALAVASRDLATARYRAERAARRAFAGWSTAGNRAIPVRGRRLVLESARATVHVERLSAELFLLHAEGRAGPPGPTAVRARVGLLLATLPPDTTAEDDGDQGAAGADSVALATGNEGAVEDAMSSTAAQTHDRNRAFRPHGRWWIPLF